MASALSPLSATYDRYKSNQESFVSWAVTEYETLRRQLLQKSDLHEIQTVSPDNMDEQQERLHYHELQRIVGSLIRCGRSHI